MTSARTPSGSQAELLVAEAGQHSPRISQAALLAAYVSPPSSYGNVPQAALLTAYAPAAAKFGDVSQGAVFVAASGGLTNVDTHVSQGAIFIAYREGIPSQTRSDTWTFVLDGHRFWVVPLGPEGDWAYDTVTKQWCKLYTQGFPGLNFSHGVMWGQRIVGGDVLYPTLYEMAASNPDDEGWRPVMHVVTGGLVTRSANKIGVSNFRLTATPGVLNDASTSVNLTFSDDNGATWSDVFPLTVTQGDTSEQLVWNALGSFSAPGRIFQISDQGGMLSIYGADASLNNYDEDDNEATGGQR